MAQLEDLVIKTPDPQLRLFLQDLVSFWNSGAFPFQIISVPPTDSPGDVQFRLFDSGGGVIRLYVYSPTSSQWVALNGSIVSGDINLGLTNSIYFGDTSTNGSWRIRVSGNNLVQERREASVWVEKAAATP